MRGYKHLMRHINKLNKMSKTKTIKRLILPIAVSAVLMLALLPLTWPQASHAETIGSLQKEIDQLNKQINGSEGQLKAISRRKNTLSNRVEQFNVQIRTIQDRINLTQAQVDKTTSEIAQTEQELARQRQLVQANATTLYKQGDPSILEILFSSDSFTDFISRQEYLEQVKDSLNEAARAAVELQQRLEAKQEQQNDLQRRQRAEEVAMQRQRQDQQNLLDRTQGREDRYQQLVSGQRAELERLEAQQRAAYEAAAARARSSGQFIATGGSGSYPWAGQPYPCWNAGCVDSWGLYYRECVSYTAWKVADSGRFVPHFAGAGNANQWPGTTKSHGIAQGPSPRKGAVAIDMSIQPYGHSMYVEAVLGDGSQIRISEYNFAGPGQYSERILPAEGFVYIYF